MSSVEQINLNVMHMQNQINVFSTLKEAEEKIIALESQLRVRKIRFDSSDFNSLSDYLLLKRYLKRITNVKRIGSYIVCPLKVKVPIGEKIVEKDRALVIGIDENNRFFVVYTDASDMDSMKSEEDIMSFIFGFSVDLSRLDTVDFTSMDFREINARVQGDIITNIVRVDKVKEAYISRLYTDSYNAIMSLIEQETLMRVSDILEEYGISSELSGNVLFIDCSWRGIDIFKLFRRIALNLELFDMFPNYYRESISIEPLYEVFYSNSSDRFSIRFDISTRYRGFLLNDDRIEIRVHYNFSRLLPNQAILNFFRNIIEGAENEGVFEETEQKFRLGRHLIHIDSAYPRQIAVNYSFPVTGRDYAITLRCSDFFTNGTKIKMSHLQHGEKTLLLPPSMFNFLNVHQPYRTEAMKNTLIMHKYFR